MIIKKYIADSVEKAQHLIKEELGSSATVLTMRYLKRSGWRGWLMPDRVEVTAFKNHEQEKIPEKETLDKNLTDLKFLIKKEPSLSSEDSLEPKEKVDALGKLIALRDEVPKKKSTKEDSSVETLDSLRNIIREELQGIQLPVSLQKDGRFLVRKGVDPIIAKQLDEEIANVLKGATFESENEERRARLNQLFKTVSAHIKTKGPLELGTGDSPLVVAIVGPTGVGKTTTLAKIASSYSRRGYHVSVITIDNVKIGAREQLQALAKQLNLDVSVVGSSAELSIAMTEKNDSDLILIDTAGQSQYRLSDIKELFDFLSPVDDLKVLLALSATTKDVDSYGCVKQFDCFDIDSLIVTKLDETIAPGMLLNLCEKGKLSLRYLTTGQNLEKDLEIANPLFITKRLLLEDNEQQFDQVREQAMMNV